MTFPFRPRAWQAETSSLAAIYLLAKGDRFDLSPLGGMAAADAVFANTYRGRYVETMKQQRPHWEATLKSHSENSDLPPCAPLGPSLDAAGNRAGAAACQGFDRSETVTSASSAFEFTVGAANEAALIACRSKDLVPMDHLVSAECE